MSQQIKSFKGQLKKYNNPKFDKRKSKIAQIANRSNFLITINLNNNADDSKEEKLRKAHILEVAVQVLLHKLKQGRLITDKNKKPTTSIPNDTNYTLELGENRGQVHSHISVRYNDNVRLNLIKIRHLLDILLANNSNGYHLNVSHGQNINSIFEAYVQKES